MHHGTYPHVAYSLRKSDATTCVIKNEVLVEEGHEALNKGLWGLNLEPFFFHLFEKVCYWKLQTILDNIKSPGNA